LLVREGGAGAAPLAFGSLRARLAPRLRPEPPVETLGKYANPPENQRRPAKPRAIGPMQEALSGLASHVGSMAPGFAGLRWPPGAASHRPVASPNGSGRKRRDSGARSEAKPSGAHYVMPSGAP